MQQYKEWLFKYKYFDWLNTETGAALTNYNPGCELLSLLENNIDKVLQ